MKILYVTELSKKCLLPNGGDLMSLNNLKLLNEVYKDIDYFEVSAGCGLGFKIKKFISSLFLKYYTLSRAKRAELFKVVETGKYTHIYIDNSRLGHIIPLLKSNGFKGDFISFFHNDEVSYLKSRLGNGIIYKPLLKSVEKAQNFCLKLSSTCLFISYNEMQQFKDYTQKSIYLPVFIESNKNIECNDSILRPLDEPYILFFGSAFFANIEGVRWLKDALKGFSSCKLLIVGKGFEKYKGELNTDNLKVIGTVDDLGPYITHADCVVSPIFSGAGMKVKVAEAMMYGKVIIGTDKTFEGYVKSNKLITCRGKEEFIKAVELHSTYAKYNHDVRALFEENYSYDSARKKLSGGL